MCVCVLVCGGGVKVFFVCVCMGVGVGAGVSGWVGWTPDGIENSAASQTCHCSASSKPTIEFAQPRLSGVKGQSSPARGYKFGCVCSYMASHYVGVR